MAQVIIYTNELGGVNVTVPTGEISIADVKVKDTPSHSIIVDSASLPNADGDFFNAWVLNGTTVTVDITKAIAYQQTLLNNIAKQEAQHRTTNVGAGIDNVLSDADWLALLSTARAAVGTASTTQALRDALNPLQEAIEANK